jgi:FlaA1/EpsC-like NDP-sugar epimerase
MEVNVVEAITNNVLGTRNAVQAALDHNAERFVLISTDKAVRPSSIYGATKRLAEMIVLNAAGVTGSVYGRAIWKRAGSRGSIIPIFKQQIAKGARSRSLIRYVPFFHDDSEAVLSCSQAASMENSGETFVLNMGEPIRILSLAEDLIRLSVLSLNVILRFVTQVFDR